MADTTTNQDVVKLYSDGPDCFAEIECYDSDSEKPIVLQQSDFERADKSLSEGEIPTESEYEIEPEDLKRLTERKRKHKQKHKEKRPNKSIPTASVPPVVHIYRQQGKKVHPTRGGDPPPFEAQYFHEIAPARDYRLKHHSETKVFFDGITIPENYLGHIFPGEELRRNKVSTSVYPFFVRGKEKEKGFWLKFYNHGEYDVMLRADRASGVSLCLTKVERFFVQREEVFTAEKELTLPTPPSSKTSRKRKYNCHTWKNKNL